MKNILTEELRKILYLNNYKKGVVLSEQEVKSIFYSLNGIPITIRNGKLYYVKTDESGSQSSEYINGVFEDFKVDPQTSQIVDEAYKINQKLVVKNLGGLKRLGKVSLFENLPFNFIAIVPKGFSDQGEVKVYGGRISEKSIDLLEDSKITESQDNLISPKTYVRKGKFGKNKDIGLYLEFFPNKQVLDIESYRKEKINTTKTTKSIDEFSTVDIEFNMEAPFELGKITLTPEAEIKLQEFIKKIEDNYKGVIGDVMVISSSSIDNDSDSIVKGNITRREANLRLSQKRAESIVNRLNDALSDSIKLNFIPKGIGETDKFAPGKKYPEVKNTKETSPNRRLVIVLPKFKKRVKK